MAAELRTRIGARAALEDLPQWSAVDGRDAIRRRMRFADFNAAFSFMTRVAMTAEALDHHPEWSNVYNRVEVVLTTHSADGVTGLDVKLAQAIDAFAAAAGVN
jgi:4a-hydroxytetrahydrobiopterin dehydratase